MSGRKLLDHDALLIREDAELHGLARELQDLAHGRQAAFDEAAARVLGLGKQKEFAGEAEAAARLLTQDVAGFLKDTGQAEDGSWRKMKRGADLGKGGALLSGGEQFQHSQATLKGGCLGFGFDAVGVGAIAVGVAITISGDRGGRMGSSTRAGFHGRKGLRL
jgi:hypothetical protein